MKGEERKSQLSHETQTDLKPVIALEGWRWVRARTGECTYIMDLFGVSESGSTVTALLPVVPRFGARGTRRLLPIRLVLGVDSGGRLGDAACR